MHLEVTLLDGTVVHPEYDMEHRNEIIAFYRKQAQHGKIKAFKVEHQTRQEELDTEE